MAIINPNELDQGGEPFPIRVAIGMGGIISGFISLATVAMKIIPPEKFFSLDRIPAVTVLAFISIGLGTIIVGREIGNSHYDGFPPY